MFHIGRPAPIVLPGLLEVLKLNFHIVPATEGLLSNPCPKRPAICSLLPDNASPANAKLVGDCRGSYALRFDLNDPGCLPASSRHTAFAAALHLGFGDPSP